MVIVAVLSMTRPAPALPDTCTSNTSVQVPPPARPRPATVKVPPPTEGVPAQVLSGALRPVNPVNPVGSGSLTVTLLAA